MEKTQNIWTIICKRAIVDDQTKLMSLVDIMEKLSLNVDMEKAPEEVKNSLKKGLLEKAMQVNAELVVSSYWNISEKDRGKELSLETVIKDHNLKKLGDGLLNFQVPQEHSHHRTFVRLSSFPVTGAGKYTISSSLKDSQGKVLAKSEAFMNVDVKMV